MFGDDLILWDAVGNREIKRIASDHVFSPLDWPMSFSQDGKFLATVPSPDQTTSSFALLNGVSGEIVRNVAAHAVGGKPSSLVSVVAFHNEAKAALLLDFVGGQTLALYETRTWQPDSEIFTLTGLRVAPYQNDMAISPDGRHIALLKTVHTELPVKDDPTHTRTYGGKLYQLVVWDVTEHRAAEPIAIDNENWPSSWPSMVRYSPDGRFVAIGMANEDPEPIRIMDAVTGQIVRKYESPKGDREWPVWGWLRSMDWSSDGRFIAFCGDDKAVHVLDANSNAEADTIMISGTCYAVAFSPDSSRLAYGVDNAVIVRKIRAK